MEALTAEAQTTAKSDYQMVRGPRPWEEDTLKANEEVAWTNQYSLINSKNTLCF